MKQEFISTVNQHDLAKVRMMLSNELLMDPRGKTFSEMLSYAKDNLSDLFEPNQPSKFEIPSDKSMWTDSLVSKMKRDLNMNFSIEKLAIFVEMAKWAGKEKAASLDEKDRERTKHKDGGATINLPERPRQRNRNTKKTAGTIVTGSGAVLAITGLCLEYTLITIVGGVVVVGGVILMVTSKD